MGSTKTYFTAFIFIFSFSVISVSAQNRLQQLHSRSLMDGAKELEPSKKVFIKVYWKDNQSLKDSYVKVDGTELEFEANEDGLISVELPASLKDQVVVLLIHGKNHYSKGINISYDDFGEVYKEIKLKRRVRIHGCPSF